MTVKRMDNVGIVVEDIDASLVLGGEPGLSCARRALTSASRNVSDSAM